MAAKSWRDVNAIYQIYPRSFMDANGDGVGDLRGVIDRLDYIKGTKNSLGIDAIWFSPFYPSPQLDMGYDVANYCDIDPLFGTLEDFKELVAKAHDLDINVMVDFVPNHTSDQHPWFVESRKSRDNTYADYYVWRDPKKDGSAPNNWVSNFGGSAWQYDETRGQYYLHTFMKEQPDLNWDNPAVREEMKRVIRFWLDLGVDGIRADAVRWISKDPKFRDDPRNKHWKGDKNSLNKFDSLLHVHSQFGDNLFKYLREMTDTLKQYDNRIMLFEDYPDQAYSTRDQYLGFYSIDPSVSAPFNFEGMWQEFKSESFEKFITEFQGMLDPDQHMPVYCFGNHDQARLVTRIGSEERARAVALIEMSLPGLPLVYYGDELGMPNTHVDASQTKDLSTTTGYTSRDPERTPMQWNREANAGFSEVEPWLPIGETVGAHNVERQLHEPDSFLSLYRRLLKLRARHAILRYGTYEASNEAPEDVFLFSRWLDDQHVFVAVNFSGEDKGVKMPHKGRIMCCTHPVDYPEIMGDGVIVLRPYEGVIVECHEHPLTERD